MKLAAAMHSRPRMEYDAIARDELTAIRDGMGMTVAELKWQGPGWGGSVRAVDDRVICYDQSE